MSERGEKRKSRVVVAAVFGLELGLLTWGVYVFVELVVGGAARNLPNVGQLAVILGAVVLIYLMYLKKETAAAEGRVVGEKYRTGALLEALPAAAMMIDAAGTVLAANPRAAKLLGVDELELSAAAAEEVPGGELGAKLAAGGSGSFEAATAGGRRLRCTATPIGGEGDSAVRLVLLEAPVERAPEPAPAGEDGRSLVRQCAETVAPVLQRSSDHLADLAVRVRMSSPHEAGRAGQLAGVAVRLLQAARRIRLAQQLVLIRGGELKPALRPEEFDLVAAVREVTGRLKSLCAATGVELAVELPEEELRVSADRARLVLTLRDLVEVCLAMTAPGGRVAVRAAGGEGEVEVSVTDNGMGMSSGELEEIFSAAGSPPVQEDYTGGIRDGLFVAKELMEACGGQLWAESAQGRGTRFNLRLPTT
jgi:signal transduction histidine kinase